MINIEFKSIIELLKAFPDEQACINHLEEMRWNGNIVSPFDETSKVYKCAGNKYKCKTTGNYFNVRTNMLFDSSNVKLQTWFLAIYLITCHKKGISSLQLHRDLNVTQKTAWFLLHRIRNCFGIELEGTDENDMLGGNGSPVEMDESFVGGKNKNRHYDKKVEQSQGRSFKDKTPVVGMLQTQQAETVIRPHKVIKDRMVKEKVIKEHAVIKCVVSTDTSAKSLQAIIVENVRPGAIIVSDEWKGYAGTSANYDHRIVDHSRKQYVNENGDTTNAVEGAWTLLKRSYMGIYHYMSRKHLQKYANEMAFRYNT